MVKARFLRFRMPEVIAFLGCRITKVAVAMVDPNAEMVHGLRKWRGKFQ